MASITFDVSDFKDEDFIAISDEFKPATVIYNSGIDSPPGKGNSKLQDFGSNSWREVFDVNLFGFVRLLNIFLDQQVRPSNYIAIGSMYASLSPNYHLYSHLHNGHGSIKHPAYGASKASLKSVIQQYAATLAPYGIRLNMLSPGGVQGSQDDQFVSKFSIRTPVGRMAESKELISAMTFLLDPDNSYFTGQDIRVDGGYGLW